MQRNSWQPAVFFNPAILLVVSVLLAVISVTFAPTLSSAAELFADFNVSPEEERVWKKASNEDIKTYGRMNESLEQMTIMIPLMSISQGNCDGFRDVDAAAKEGKANDQYVLALAFKFGWCVRKNIRTAARWLAKAAEAGSRHAQEGLGLLLLKGDGEIKADPHSAADHLRKAAENGMENSQYALALMYTDGTGVPQDIQFAHTWLEKAATKGHEKAILKLAMLFYEGSGVERSVSKATDWLLFGAQRGSVICQYSAARVLAASNRKQDHIQAHMLVNLAAAKNTLSKLTEMITKLRSNIEAVLSPQEIAHAQQLARNWKQDENVKPPNYQEPEQEAPPALPDDPTATTEQIAARNELITRGIPITRFAFFGAIQRDDLELVKLFRKAGASLEAVALGAGDGPMGVSPLYVSVDWGALKVYRYLMDHGVNINARAVESGYTPLVRALAHDRLDIARELLDRGADATKPKGRRDIINSSALGFAISQPDPKLVRRVLAQGGSIKERYGNGMTPLVSAIKFDGSIEIMKVLLEAGVDINDGGMLGETPISACFDFSKMKIRLDVLQFLLENKAEVENKTYQRTPLFTAAWMGSSKAIKLLVQFGASPNEVYRFPASSIPMGITDNNLRDVIKNGGTPFLFSTGLGHVSAAATLLELGADPDVMVRGKLGIHTAETLAHAAGIKLPKLGGQTITIGESATTAFGRYYALVIGNDNYASLPKLENAVADARAISKVLSEQYGFSVTTLIDATRSQIIKALEAFRARLMPTDNLLIYYAGHGWLDTSADRGFWQPVDAKSSSRTRWISNSTITDTLKAIKASHVLVVADSCFSGTLARSSRGVVVKELAKDQLATTFEQQSRTVLTSGGLEPVSDTGGGEHSVFAKALLDVLQSNQAILEGAHLFKLVIERVRRSAQQTPRYKDIYAAGHERDGDFLFVPTQ